MNLNGGKVFNRLGEFFEQGMDKVQETSRGMEKKLRKESRAMARRARGGFEEGRDRIMTMEQALMRTVQERPVLFVLAGVSLLLLLLLKMLVDQSTRSEE